MSGPLTPAERRDLRLRFQRIIDSPCAYEDISMARKIHCALDELEALEKRGEENRFGLYSAELEIHGLRLECDTLRAKLEAAAAKSAGLSTPSTAATPEPKPKEIL